MCTILVVDDDKAIRDAVGMLLLLEGHECLMAPDGESALNLLVGSATPMPRCALIDLRMPRMNGLQLGVTLASNYPDIFRIAMTGATELCRSDDYRHCGFAGVLTKPFTSTELLDVCRKTCEVHRN